MHARTHIHTYNSCVLLKQRLHICESTTGEYSSTRMKSWLSSLFSNKIQSLYIALDKVTKCSSMNSFSERIQTA